jgi:hypothetical protein
LQPEASSYVVSSYCSNHQSTRQYQLIRLRQRYSRTTDHKDALCHNGAKTMSASLPFSSLYMPSTHVNLSSFESFLLM